MCRWHLEQLYGPTLDALDAETNKAQVVADVLLAGLRARPANKMPDEFSRKEMYELLDDLSEQQIKEIWDYAKKSFGFLRRIMGISDERLAELALNQNELGAANSSSQPVPANSSEVE